MRRFLSLPLALLVCAPAWAGQDYPAHAGEQVKAGELIVRLKSGATSSVILSYLPTALVTPLSHLNLFHVRASFLPANVEALLAADGLVDFVEPNRIRQVNVAQPNDPLFSQQWNLTNLGALQAWTVFPNQFLTSATAGTNRIQVAVLDTGIDCTHPDFMNVGASSTNSALGGQLLWSASQALVATTIASPTCSWQDDYGHGTHVSGIIAAAANNGIGVAGLAYPVQLVAYKVLDNTGNGTDVTIADAIMDAADAGIPIISLSLGGAGYSQSIQLAVNYAWQRNSLVVAAAGNSSSNGIFYPADANYAVGVSATDVNSNFASSFSNFGNGIKLAGPGVSVLSTVPFYSAPISSSTGYAFLSGTSMAAPHVSAVAGLVATATPGTSAAAILLRMEQTATSTTSGGGWNQDFGYGIVHAYDAVSGTLRSATLGAVTGQVTDSNANPITNATVTIGGSSVTTASTGLFRFGILSAGTYAVQVSASSYTTQNLTVTVPPGGDATLAVMMGVTYGEFTGTVTNQGVAVPNAVVQAISANLIQGTTIADTFGHYTLWVPAGTFSLRVTNIGAANSTVTGQTVTAGGTTTANVTIPQLGSLSGTVTDPTGTPDSSATVSITGGSLPITLTAGVNGQFSANALASGTYTLACSEFGFVTNTLTGLVVSPGNATNGNCQLGALSAPSWYNTSWSDRKPITINYSQVSGSGNLTNFPVLISLPSDANLSGAAQASGNDILFTGPDGVTKLNHEIETYTSSTGQLIAWVQVPILSSTTNTVLYMYYGNASATNQQNPTGVWTSNYSAVLHLANGTTLSASDSTSNGNNGTIHGATATSGQIDGAASFNGTNAYISTPLSINSGDFTTSIWANTSDNTTYYRELSGAANGNYVWAFGGGTVRAGAGMVVTSPATGSWHQYVLARQSGTDTFYIDGVPKATASDTETYPNIYIGSLGSSLDFYEGAADEFRLATAALSSGWIATEYNNEKSPSTFFSVGAQQTNGGPSPVSITVTSVPTGLTVTVDGSNCTTPCATFQWTPGSSHTLAAATQAGATGTQYVFASWTGNAGSPDQVTAPSTPTTYTATFTTQYYLTTAASPSSEGSISPASEWVNAGTVVSVSATATTGNQFTGFSGGALSGTTTPQNLTMNVAATVTANFSPNPVSITVTSVPTGLTVTVDGSNCTTPCAAFQWTPGSSHTLAAATQAGATGTQYVFVSWTGSAGSPDQVTAPSTPTTYTATFTTQYYLTTAASPSSEGSISPASEWVNAGTVVSVSATATAGNQFTGFSGGALSGATTPQNLTMNAAATVTANFNAVNGSSWYNNAWVYQKAITINSSQVSGSSNLTNFPVLISLPSDANLSAAAQASGNDIVFTASDGLTKLNHEIELYTSSTGALIAWVQVPSVSPTTNTTIYMYYGNPSAANQQNPSGVWDANYKGVWHFSNSVGLSGNDSTANGYALTNNNVVATPGEIGGAASFDGTNAYFSNAALGITSGSSITVSFWNFVAAANVQSSSAFTIGGQDSPNRIQSHAPWSDQTLYWDYGNYGSGGRVSTAYGSYLGAWTLVELVYNASSTSHLIYLNGSLVASSVNSNTPVANQTGIDIGVWAGYDHANLDEFRVSSSARPAAWIATEYNNQKSPSTFFTVGAQQTNGGPSPVSITVTSVPTGLTVTVDGSNCTTPCAAFQWTPGSSHTLAAATQAGATGTQYVFVSWTGSAGSPDQVTAPSTPSTYTATFTTQYYLTTAASPPTEGSISPVSEWVNAGTVVSVSATATTGNQFTGFSGGALSGATTPQNLTMNAAATVTANFNAVNGSSWYNNAWVYQKAITINSSQVSGSSNLTNFPVLISLPSDANLSAAAQASGNDIVFTASDGLTKLNHEIELYTSSTGALIAWVQVPSVSPTTNTTIYMYYGNPSAANQQNPSGVWDANYKGVWHFSNSVGLSGNDSTANGYALTNNNVVATPGEIGGAASFDGTNAYFSNAALGITSGSSITVSFWNFVAAANVQSSSAFTIGGQDSPNRIQSHAPWSDQTLYWDYGNYGSGGRVSTAYGSYLGAWTLVELVYNASSTSHLIYLNGSLVASSVNSNTPVANQTGIDIGVWAGYDHANLDEFRVSSSARPAAWIATEYNNQKSPSTFFTVGAQQTN